MTLSAIDRRQGHARVSFEEAVQVFPAGSPQTIWARAANLSESGIFVSSSRLFGVGTEINVRLPLPSGDGRLILRGRVVRVSNGRRPGMGIAFQTLEEADAAALRRAVMIGQPSEWTREAKVWFAGTSQPTRVQAHLGPEGLRLFCDLGFLRLGLPVTLFFPDENDRSYSGVLKAANLHTEDSNDVPRLELALSLDEELADAERTWTYWPPPPVCQTGGDGDVPPDATLIELTPLGARLPEPPPEEQSREEPESPSEELVIEAVLPEDGEQEVYALEGGRAPSQEIDVDQAAVSGAIDARLLSSPELAEEPSVQTLSSVLPDASCRFDWEMETLPAAEQSHWDMSGNEVAPPSVRRRWRRASVWLWLLALSMAAITAASMTYTNLWQRVKDKLLVPGSEPRLGVLVPADSPAARRPLLGPHAATTTAAGSESADEEEAAGEPTGAKGSAPTIEAGSATVVIPIEGSLDEARHYLLADPDGVAVNLPHARPKIRFGDYRLKRAGFRMVWVRRRPQGGLHLRVLHEPGSSAEVRLSSSAVRVSLRPSEASEPAQPAQPAKPAQPVKPAQPAQPAQPADPAPDSDTDL